MLNHTAAEISHPTGKKQTTQLKDIQKRLELRVLSQEDWDHWITKGFVVVKKAVSRDACQQLENALWEFDEKDPNDPSTWYAPQRRPHVRVELNNVGMTEIYHHQRMWDNRQSQRVYDAFVDIWDQEELWVAIDRANINPPKKVKANPDGFVHWDVDTTARPLPIGVQGILSVKEQDIETGGFQAVPYLFEFFEDWVKTQPSDRNPLLPDMTGLSRENITLEAGDLLIFNSLLPHGVRPNHSEGRVRMAQYLSMFPAELENETERAERIRLWQNIEAPNRPDFPGDPRGWEKQHYGPADLTQLGRKLLGLDLWGDTKT
tara:strand:+ start:558 stop:1511 length:954 start_codon:yes stop_codon:yes gene_type:complete